VRRLSELINTVQVGGSADAVKLDHRNSIDLCEGDKSKMSLEVGNDNDSPVSNQKVGEAQSRAVKNNVNRTELDIVDDGSSLMNWVKNIHKKVRTKKTGPDSCVVSNSNSDKISSSVGDLGHIYYECQSWE